MPQPMRAEDKLCDQLILDLNDIVSSGLSEHVRWQRLRDLETEAIALERMHRAFGYCVRGSIAAARCDVVSMHRFHLGSIELIPGHMPLHRNYIISMGAVGLHEEALSYALEAYKSFIGDPEIVDVIADEYFALGVEVEYVRFAELFKEMTKNEHRLWHLYTSEMEELRDLSAVCAVKTSSTIARMDAEDASLSGR